MRNRPEKSRANLQEQITCHRISKSEEKLAKFFVIGTSDSIPGQLKSTGVVTRAHGAKLIADKSNSGLKAILIRASFGCTDSRTAIDERYSMIDCFIATRYANNVVPSDIIGYLVYFRVNEAPQGHEGVATLARCNGIRKVSFLDQNRTTDSQNYFSSIVTINRSQSNFVSPYLHRHGQVETRKGGIGWNGQVGIAFPQFGIGQSTMFRTKDDGHRLLST